MKSAGHKTNDNVSIQHSASEHAGIEHDNHVTSQGYSTYLPLLLDIIMDTIGHHHGYYWTSSCDTIGHHMIQFSESTYIKSSHESINLTNDTTLEKSPEQKAITT